MWRNFNPETATTCEVDSQEKEEILVVGILAGQSRFLLSQPLLLLLGAAAEEGLSSSCLPPPRRCGEEGTSPRHPPHQV